MVERITHEEYSQWKKDAVEMYELDHGPLSTGVLGTALNEIYLQGFENAFAFLEFFGRIAIEKPVKYR